MIRCSISVLYPSGNPGTWAIFLLQHFQFDDHVPQKLAARGVSKRPGKAQLMNLADVMQKCAGQEQVAVDRFRIIAASQVAQLEERDHVVQQPADESMMQRLGCRRIFVGMLNLRGRP